SANTSATLVTQQNGASTADLFQALTSGGTTVFSVNNWGEFRSEGMGKIGSGAQRAGRFTVRDAGTSWSILGTFAQDDANTKGLSVLNETYSTTEDNGLTLWQTNTGVGRISSAGAADPAGISIGTTGNVGIGTATPGAELHVKGLSNTSSVLIEPSSAGTAGLYLGNTSAARRGIFEANNLTGEIKIGGNFSSYFPTFYSGGAEAMRISTSGSVGIGTSNPITPLDVSGTDTDGTFRVYDQTAASGVSRAIVRAGAGQSTTNLMEWQNNAGTVLSRIDSTGKFVGDGSLLTGISGSISGLTAGRVPFASGATTLTDSSDFTWNNTTKRLLLYGPSSSTVMEVAGASSTMPTSGSSPAAVASFRGNNNNTLYFGNTGTSPWSAWLQVADNSDFTVKYPLALQPNGGYVGIGTTAPGSSLDLSQRTDALSLPSGTLAQRPGSPVNGMIRYNSTVPWAEAYQNGSWKPFNGIAVICNSGTASSTTTSSTETNHAICTIPAGIMGTNGRLKIEYLYKFTGTSGTKTPAVRFSATSGDTAGGMVVGNSTTNATTLAFRDHREFWNSNSTSAQIAFPSASTGFGNTNTSPPTGAIDTANASYVNFNCSCANNATDTCQILAYTVTLIQGM
ncbi:MAG: hypothetical protein K2X47_17730, partial [Bdellovibrionales bacterium]|nr:hypothetical protein [Bdellovibrionales bacterium]